MLLMLLHWPLEPYLTYLSQAQVCVEVTLISRDTSSLRVDEEGYNKRKATRLYRGLSSSFHSVLVGLVGQTKNDIVMLGCMSEKAPFQLRTVVPCFLTKTEFSASFLCHSFDRNRQPRCIPAFPASTRNLQGVMLSAAARQRSVLQLTPAWAGAVDGCIG